MDYICILRFIADALGEKVSWNGETGTIYIGEADNSSISHWSKDIKHMSFKKEENHPSGTGAIGPRYSYYYNERKSEM